MTGSSAQGIKTVLHPVSDLATAKAVYAALLGVPPQTDGSYYVGFEAAGQHIGLVPGGRRDTEHRLTNGIDVWVASRWPRRTAGSASHRAASRLGASCPTAS